MILLLLLACAGERLTCGPGTTQRGDVCVPDLASDDPGGLDDTAADPERAVYILAGQSNMDGYAVYTGLPPAWRVADPAVPLFWSGWGEFRGLAPAAYGGGPYTGPEVSFGHSLAEAGQELALVKHAVGGTDLAVYWDPGEDASDPDVGEGWSVLVSTMQAAAVALDASGQPWRWAGFVWMQGESDALDAGMSRAYEENLRHLLARVREETGEPALPAVIGLIGCEDLCPYLDEVRAAQQAVADADAAVTAVETLDLPRNVFDPWHYDGPSERVLGERFAAAALGHPADRALSTALKVSSYRLDYDGDFTVGWTFSLEETVTVTDVGAFGPDATALTTSTEVGFWDRDTEALVARVAVPAWTEAPSTWRDGFWYTAVDPFLLPAGDYVVALTSWSSDLDRYANEAVVKAGQGLSVEGGAYVASYWLSYPTEQFATTTGALAFLGPSFLYLR